jgi:hypothetical protein
VDDVATAGPGALPEGKINIVRLTDANAAEPSRAQEPVSAVQFHPSGRLVMVASGDKMLRFFAVDGDKVRVVPLSHGGVAFIDSIGFPRVPCRRTKSS